MLIKSFAPDAIVNGYASSMDVFEEWGFWDEPEPCFFGEFAGAEATEDIRKAIESGSESITFDGEVIGYVMGNGLGCVYAQDYS